MLDVYNFRGDVWLCHSKGGKCFDFTAFVSKPNCAPFTFRTREFSEDSCSCRNSAVSCEKWASGKAEVCAGSEPAIDTMREVEAFLSSNPSEIVTLILEDYERSERGLPKLFLDAGLARYRFPVSRMPRRGGEWPRVRDMVVRGHRLLVFTSARWKQAAEGIA